MVGQTTAVPWEVMISSVFSILLNSQALKANCETALS